MFQTAAIPAIRSSIAYCVSRIALAVGFWGFLTAGSVQAQVPESATLLSQQKKLILVVGVQPQEGRRRMTPELLTSVMRQGIEKTKNACKCKGDPVVTPLSPEFYSGFSSLVNMTERKESETLIDEKAGILVTPTSETVEDFAYVFRLTLRDPGKYLYELKVDYEDGSTDTFRPSKEGVEQVTQAGTDTKNRLQYWVRLKKYPEKYSITTQDLNQPEAPDQTYAGDWPRTRQHFAVTFDDFQGDFNVLRDRLLDDGEDGTSEPVDSIAEFADNRFFLASMGFTINPGGGSGKPDNRITIKVQPPKNIDVVWVKLPYTNETLTKEQVSWNSLLTGEAVMAKLKGEDPDTRAETEAVNLSSTSAPKWYKLKRKAPGSQEFSREFILDDQAEFVKNFSPLSVAVVHEATGRTPVASTIGRDWIQILNITDKDDADLSPLNTSTSGPARSNETSLTDPAQSGAAVEAVPK